MKTMATAGRVAPFVHRACTRSASGSKRTVKMVAMTNGSDDLEDRLEEMPAQVKEQCEGPRRPAPD
jgi:hypothetical protein